MSSPSASNIHGVLDYAVSKALLEGKVGKVSISVPLSDLINAGEGLRTTEDGTDLVLKVDIQTSFDIGDAELETEFELDKDPEYE